jgi:hypothetical protein
MKVEWRNFRLTFEAETPTEDEALKAVWVAFGSQVDNRPGVDDYELESRKFVDTLLA